MLENENNFFVKLTPKSDFVCQANERNKIWPDNRKTTPVIVCVEEHIVPECCTFAESDTMEFAHLAPSEQCKSHEDERPCDSIKEISI